MKHHELRGRLLLALLKKQRVQGFNHFIEPKDAAAAENLPYRPGELRVCIMEFRNLGYINDAFTLGGGEDGGLSCSLTSAGIEEAEKLEENYAKIGALTTEDGNHILLEQSDTGASPTASTNISSTSFQSGLTDEAQTIPAAGRYVSVSDNQNTFNEITSELSKIKDEFAKDHNKGDIEAEISKSIASEIAATIAQIKEGFVRISLLTDSLKPSLNHALVACAAYPGLVKIIEHVLSLLETLLKAAGAV